MRAVLALASAILLILLSVAPAAASPPQPVTIELLQACNDAGCVVPSPFWAKGPAVDAGVICPEGLASNLDEFASGPGQWKTGFHIVTHTTKLFDCADGSGSFVLSISYHIKFLPPADWSSVGPWNVDAGTGAHQRLHGTGSMESWPADDYLTTFYDVFTGAVHID
jgi:hypothetical protein